MIDLLPDALADALGVVVADVRRECRREIEVVSAESRATIAELKAQIAELQGRFKAAVDAEICRVSEALANVRDGRDADPAAIADLVRVEVAKLPPAAPGKPADPEQVRAVVVAEVERAVQSLPPPADGHTPTEAELLPPIETAVSRALAERPAPKDGGDGRDGIDGKDGIGRDGKDGRDGIGLAGALIDRGGSLIVTLGDGSARDLGPVVGRDGKNGEDGASGVDGKDGAPGLGFDDLTVTHDGERGFVFRMVRGEQIREFPVSVPAMIYRGVYREDAGGYQRGDVVTIRGSMYHCEADTQDKPGEGSKAWTLAVKNGKDGRDGKDGDRGERGPEGRAGRDLTQMDQTGKKW